MIQPPAVVTLFTTDDKDNAQPSGRDLEKLLLGFDVSVTFPDSVKEHGQQSFFPESQQSS